MSQGFWKTDEECKVHGLPTVSQGFSKKTKGSRRSGSKNNFQRMILLSLLLLLLLLLLNIIIAIINDLNRTYENDVVG